MNATLATFQKDNYQNPIVVHEFYFIRTQTTKLVLNYPILRQRQIDINVLRRYVCALVPAGIDLGAYTRSGMLLGKANLFFISPHKYAFCSYNKIHQR